MNELEMLKQRVTELENLIRQMASSNTLPHETERAFHGRGFLMSKNPPTGVLDENGMLYIAKQAPVIASTTVYVSISNGGATNLPITITNGIRTA